MSAVGVGPDMVDALITDALRRVCELLGADVGTLESLSEDAINPVSRQSWVRHAAAVGLEPALAIRVPVQGGGDFALSIGMTGGGSPWSGAVADSLRALAHVMVLIVLRAQQAQELERIRLNAASSASSPARAFDQGWDADEFQTSLATAPRYAMRLRAFRKSRRRMPP